MKHWYILDLNPIPWRVGPVGTARSSDGKRFKGYVGRDQELHNYKEAVKEALKEKSPVKLSGNVEITVFFWRNLAEYVTDKKKAKNNEADGTNMLKAVEDACQGILFDNDRDNTIGHWYIVDQGTEVVPKIIICVEEMSEVGMEDALQLIPDDVFTQAFPNGQMSLVDAMEAPRPFITPDDSRYAGSGDDF